VRVEVPINPPKCLVVWSADRSRSGFCALQVVRLSTRVVWFSGPVFLINWVNSLLLIKIRENISFHRPSVPKKCIVKKATDYKEVGGMFQMADGGQLILLGDRPKRTI
jgi:hypothetical protein